jgi:hypothetical protein
MKFTRIDYEGARFYVNEDPDAIGEAVNASEDQLIRLTLVPTGQPIWLRTWSISTMRSENPYVSTSTSTGTR